jgi:hypothetical protein
MTLEATTDFSKRAHWRTEPGEVRRLSLHHMDAIERLQYEVSIGLPEGFVRNKTRQQLTAYLDGTLGGAYGIFEQGGLSAMGLLRIPSSAHPHGGPPFPKVPAADWPLHAAFLENSMVSLHARGRGHQRALIDARLAHAAHAGMRWACAGVHLANVASWSNLLAQGMAMVGSRTEPGGYSLVALLRGFGETALQYHPDHHHLAPMHDVFAHQNLMEAGYVGVRLTPEGLVVYQRGVDANS